MDRYDKRELIQALNHASEYISMALDVGVNEGLFDEDEAEGDANMATNLTLWAQRIERDEVLLGSDSGDSLSRVIEERDLLRGELHESSRRFYCSHNASHDVAICRDCENENRRSRDNAVAEACAKEMDRMHANLLKGAGPDGWASNEETAHSMRCEAIGYERAAGLIRQGKWRDHADWGYAR